MNREPNGVSELLTKHTLHPLLRLPGIPYDSLDDIVWTRNIASIFIFLTSGSFLGILFTMSSVDRIFEVKTLIVLASGRIISLRIIETAVFCYFTQSLCVDLGLLKTHLS